MNKANPQSGFTFIEMLLYVAISGFILISISVFLSTVIQSRIKNQTIAEVEQQGLFVMQAVTQALRNADTINSPATGATAASLSINTTTAANNPTVFDLSSGVMRIKEGSAAVVPLTNSRVTVSALTFKNLSRPSTPGTVQIQFTITYNNTIGRNEYEFSQSFTTSASLRQP